MKLYLGNYVWTDKNGPPRWDLPAGMTGSIDLRPLAEQAQRGGAGGLAIFAGDSSDSALDLLGRPDEPISFKARSALVKRFGLSAAGDTLADAIHSLLMAGDPKGEAAHRPMLPTRGCLEVHLGGKLRSRPFVWGDAGTSAVRDVLQADFRQQFTRNPDQAKKTLGFLEQQYKFKGDDWKEFVPLDLRRDVDGPRKPETTITDDFTRADGSTIGNLLTWTEVQDDWSTVSNQANLVTTSGSTWSSARAESDLSSADHYAQCVAITMSNAFSAVGAICRFNPSATTYYVSYLYASDNKQYLGKNTAGTLTNLTSAAITLGLPDTVKFTVNGSSLEGFQDGASRVTLTDTSITGNTRTGIMAYQSGGGSCVLDDFEASDLAASGIVYTQLERTTRGINRGVWTGF